MEPQPPTPPLTRDEVYQQLLAVRCQLGERAAMVELVRAWERPLLFYVRRLVSGEDEALNVMQEVWLRVFTGLTSLRDPGRLAPWLYTIARHTLMDHLRGRYTQQSHRAAEEKHCSEADADDADMTWLIAAEEVYHGLSLISVVDREVLTLYFLQDLSIDEVAGVLSIPPGTVKSRLFYARQALRAALRGKDNDKDKGQAP